MARMSDDVAVATEAAADEAEVRVSWAELFFDLVFVFAVTEVAAGLRADPDWAGVGRAAVMFVPIYWLWVGVCVYANTHDVETVRDRLAIFAVGLAGLFMALAAPQAYGDRGILFAVAYLAARVVLFALVARGHRMPMVSYTVALCVSGPLLVVGAFVPAWLRVFVWGAAAVTDLATPALARRRLMAARFAPSHLAERFGGFLIIALGESIVAIGAPAASAGHLRAATVGAVAAAFVLACALWWVYYVFAASAVRHALLTSGGHRVDVIRQVLSYGHLSFIGAIIAVSVGIVTVVRDPLAPLAAGPVGLLYGGCALYLATFGYTRWRMFGTVSTTRLSAAAAVLLLLIAAPHVPGLAALCGLGLIVVALNVVERVIVRRRESA